MADEPKTTLSDLVTHYEKDPRGSAEEIIRRLGLANQVWFRTLGIDPPASLFVKPDDQLALYINNDQVGVTLELNTRILRLDGSIIIDRRTVTPTSDASLTFTVIKPSIEGFLLSTGIGIIAGGVKRGNCFVTLVFQRALFNTFTGSQVLFARYVESDPICSWPIPCLQSPSEGPGFTNIVVGTAPALGAEIAETVPARRLWKLRSFAATLTASAAAANRAPILRIEDGAANFFFRSAQANFVVAGGVGNLCWAPSMAYIAPGVATNTAGMADLPPEMFLRPGAVIRTLTLNIQAGDQYAAPVYNVEEWIEP